MKFFYFFRVWFFLSLFMIVFAGCQGDRAKPGEKVDNAAVEAVKTRKFLPADGSPYGVCAHISRGGEHQIAQKEMAVMKEAGIQWVRTDFDWSGVERKEGQWDFSYLDETVKWAQEAGIDILPIMGYDVAWARPAQKHLDKWATYVRTIVTRYKDRLRYWEVWNEENISHFWKGAEGPEEYVELLKVTYKTIKEVDPGLTVLFGGTAGIPWEYIEGAYKFGAKDSFDVMNIHPYRYPKRPEPGNLYEDINKVRELMTKYGDGNKPIWITEMGWPTHCPPDAVGGFLNGIFEAGVKSIRGDRVVTDVAILADRDYQYKFEYEMLETVRIMSGKRNIIEIALAGLASLDPDKVQVLIMPPEEGFAVDYFDAVESYVRRGGIVVFWGGMPLYYQYKKGSDGTWNKSGADENFRRRLHIGWEAWWTRKGIVPESTKKLEVPAEFRDAIKLPKSPMEATRFLTDKALKPGDRMIPLIKASAGEYTGVPAAAYALNSDLKGGVIVMTNQQIGNNVTPERQAIILPRAYLVSLQAGIKRIFWYEFQATEHDLFYNEDHFGIVHRDLSPKPAYVAMQALTRARPAGSMMAEGDWRADGIYHPCWKRPDGQTAYALWVSEGETRCKLVIRGKVVEAFDHAGNKVDLQVSGGSCEVALKESILYVVGPQDIVVTATIK
ncbi:MAG: hypothetical protein A2283_18285 [Lentisphaerae bacterium RIFOXYA12_FULL_48_11]|nr:MAG: hypothetical protein A2283_18285 [Lentisphaerae bacterium RIFOXYA12_FULL_48_11]